MPTPSSPPTPLPEVDWLTFVADFHPSVHAKLAERIAEPGVDGLFMARQELMDSVSFGQRAAVVYGPDCTLQADNLIVGRLVGDVPSRMKTMIHRVTKAAFLACPDWRPPAARKVPIRATKFGHLEDGDEFDFVGPDPLMNTFLKTCRKTGRFTYTDEDGVKHRIGSLSAKVYHAYRETYE